MFQPPARARHGRSSRAVLVISAVLVAVATGESQRSIFTLRGNAPGDHFGWSIREAGDFNRDGFPDFVVGAPFSDVAGPDSGSAMVVSGKTGLPILTLNGSAAGDVFGFSVSVAGDVDNDSFPDVIVGAPGRLSNATTAGYARVFSGRTGGVLHTFRGVAIGDAYGYAVSGAGDVDRDGFADVLIGAPGDEDDPQVLGSMQVRSGRTGDAIHTRSGPTLRSMFGAAVSGVGDVDEDGHADFVVGIPLADVGQGLEDAGSARLYSGRTGGVVREFTGVQSRGEFGSSVRAAGDVNLDTFQDYIIGARFELDRGRAHVISGANETTIWTFQGPTRAMWFGHAVSSAGDVDRDGYADVVVGAPIDGVTPGIPQQTPILGSIKIFSGQTGTLAFEAFGTTDMTWMGWSVSGVGDVNRDGAGDLLVGTPLADSGRGLVQVMSGSPLALSTDVHSLSVFAPGAQTQTFSLMTSPPQAGRPYLVLGSVTGVAPGLRIGPVTVPLNPDGWMMHTVSFPNLPPLINTLGVLNGQGRATAAFSIPGGGVLSVLSGLTFHHAFVLLSGGTASFASNAVPLTFTN